MDKLDPKLEMLLLKWLNNLLEDCEDVTYDKGDISGCNPHYAIDSEALRSKIQHRIEELA